MLTSQQLAAQLNISSSTVRLYARERLIPFVETPGGHRRFDLDDVRAALALAQPRHFQALDDDDAPRLSEVPDTRFERVHGWDASTEADSHDLAEAEAEADGQARPIPMIGVPGSSRFVVGHGARV